ncbi:hypothetical protein [Bacteroides pyogenes]|uniref:hypothetical protein n=1 Tax=Bacteroides pyogenes TaxID=310300 RepID=UPI001F4193E4|nr:hypothetical protein [Bacteroides pyogenes]MCE9108214.1 hypothetical protein [Bacteroides pyogenes]
MKFERIFPETLLELARKELDKSSSFEYIEGVQPFLMKYDDVPYFVYIKNLSSAYFKDRPGTTRAQLPKKESFDEIKKSPNIFVFLGYDQENDVFVCWDFNVAKERLNVGKSVSFYSRISYQEEVEEGEFLRINLKNGDCPIVFKRKSICDFFDKINTFFDVKLEGQSDSTRPVVEDGKIKAITEEELLKQLRPLIKISSPHTLEAISVAEKFYEGKYSKMTMRDWLQLVKNID